jgi:hypothetical protein
MLEALPHGTRRGECMKDFSTIYRNPQSIQRLSAVGFPKAELAAQTQDTRRDNQHQRGAAR